MESSLPFYVANLNKSVAESESPFFPDVRNLSLLKIHKASEMFKLESPRGEGAGMPEWVRCGESPTHSGPGDSTAKASVKREDLELAQVTVGALRGTHHMHAWV